MAQAFLPQLQNLEGSLNNFGATERQDAQTALANARARQQMDIQKQYADMAAKKFQFDVQNTRQQEAIRNLNQQASVLATQDNNPQLAALLQDQTMPEDIKQQVLMNSGMASKLPKYYGSIIRSYSPDQRNLVGSYVNVFGGAPTTGNISQAPGMAGIPSAGQPATKETVKQPSMLENLEHQEPASNIFEKGIDTASELFADPFLNAAGVTVDYNGKPQPSVSYTSGIPEYNQGNIFNPDYLNAINETRSRIGQPALTQLQLIRAQQLMANPSSMGNVMYMPQPYQSGQ